jgi:hypothetical protein
MISLGISLEICRYIIVQGGWVLPRSRARARRFTVIEVAKIDVPDNYGARIKIGRGKEPLPDGIIKYIGELLKKVKLSEWRSRIAGNAAA